jgi:serine phosphatase RsbU (regulator of sigma subunit)
LGIYAIAFLVFLGAPVLAWAWSERPFLGFMVEQTLVVPGVDGEGWVARDVGIAYPQHVVQIGSKSIDTLDDFDAAVAGLSVGDYVEVRTISPQGLQRTYPSILVKPFALIDQLRLFWLPYGIGLAYLAISLWIYHLRGHTLAGRAFSYFCALAAIVTVLIFDLSTTHAGSALWTLAIPQLGGALLSLGLVFPEIWQPWQRYRWLRYLPYLLSLGLGIWGLSVLYDQQNPWAYVSPWRYSYYYLVLAILIFIGIMLYRQYKTPSAIVRQQARIVLWGSLIAFLPLTFWITGPIFGIKLDWNPVFFVPFLVVFPLAIGLAILRYRLWDIDVMVNRTLVYAVLMLLLVMVYYVILMGLQQVFRAVTGSESDLAAVISILLIVGMFYPLRQSVQGFIDRRFYRNKYVMARTLEAFSQTLRNQVDLPLLVAGMENVIEETIMPTRVYTWLHSGNAYRVFRVNQEPAHEKAGVRDALEQIEDLDIFVSFMSRISGAMDIDKITIDSPVLDQLRAAGLKILVPLITHGELIGWLGLGPRLSEQEYSADDRMLLFNLAVQAAPVVRVAQLVVQQRAEALERQRIEQEMNVARRIQKALLPKELPKLENWGLAAYYQPARAVGGDFYDFLALEDGRQAIFIGDVTDKGVPAALVMATTRTLLRAVAKQEASPGEVLARVNNLLNRDMPQHMFVTCLYGILDPKSGRLQFANAGQNLPFRRTRQGVMELRATGMPLGLLPDMVYEEREIKVEPGESIIFYSDGLVEAHNAEREMFGSPRLRTLLEDEIDDSATLLQGLLGALKDFTGENWEQEDDITLVGLKRTGGNGSGAK